MTQPLRSSPLRFTAFVFPWLCFLYGLMSFYSLPTPPLAATGSQHLGGDRIPTTQANYSQSVSVNAPPRVSTLSPATDPGNASPKAIPRANGGGTARANARLHSAEPSPEYQALVDLYNSTNGPNWSRKDNWLTGDSPCGWYGVSCTNGRVTILDLQSNQLSGSLPASLSNLTNLQVLRLTNNQLRGSIPASLSTLSNLQYLDLRDNQLSGNIPASLSTLSNLQYLFLDNNHLSGSIPTSFSALTEVQAINLGDNDLSGCIPASLSKLCNKNNFYVGNNAGLPNNGNFVDFCAYGLGSDVALVTAIPNPALVGQTLSLSVTAGSAYRWSGPNGFSATDQRPSLSLTSPQQSGLYSVTVTNGTTSCRPTATVNLTVNPNQYPVLESGAIYSIQVRHSGKTLDVYGASEADGGRVVQWPANNQVNQRWQLMPTDNGYYSLKSVNSGKFLEVYAFQNQDGAQVNQWTSHGGYNQQFKPILTNDGYYYLQARHSQKYLDIDANSQKDGAFLQQWSRTGGANQQFRFTRINSPGARLASGVEEGEQPVLLVYPNPARDQLRVKGTAGSWVRLVDEMGRVRAQGVMSKEGWAVDVSAYGPGIYGVQLEEGKGMVTRKVVIAH